MTGIHLKQQWQNQTVIVFEDKSYEMKLALKTSLLFSCSFVVTNNKM